MADDAKVSEDTTYGTPGYARLCIEVARNAVEDALKGVYDCTHYWPTLDVEGGLERISQEMDDLYKLVKEAPTEPAR